jgi:hypothetical protein
MHISSKSFGDVRPSKIFTGLTFSPLPLLPKALIKANSYLIINVGMI